MGIKYCDFSGFAHWNKPTPVTSMQMQSHAQADRCTGFLPNVWAYEITSAFHLLVRIWFIKWYPTTVLIYKVNWCTVYFFSPLFLQRGLLEPHSASPSYGYTHGWTLRSFTRGAGCGCKRALTWGAVHREVEVYNGLYNSLSSLVSSPCLVTRHKMHMHARWVFLW